MNLRQQVGVLDLDRLAELWILLEIVSVTFRRTARRVVLQASDHVEDCVLGEHDLKQLRPVEQEDVLEDLEQVVEAFLVVEVLAHVKQIEELLDVALVLQHHGQLLLAHLRAEAGGNDLVDVFKAGHLARRQLNGRR